MSPFLKRLAFKTLASSLLDRGPVFFFLVAYQWDTLIYLYLRFQFWLTSYPAKVSCFQDVSSRSDLRSLNNEPL